MKYDDNTRKVYIVDDEYKLVYISDNLKSLFPEVHTGDYCYKRFCGLTSPCENCPVADDAVNQKIFYNSQIGEWLNVTASQIVWPENQKTYNWMIGHSIEQENESLISQLTEAFAYDELCELNLTRGTYRLLSYQQNERIPPKSIKTIEELINYNADNFIHPNDRERFLKFWDFSRIKKCLLNGNDHQIRNEHFRLKPGSMSYDMVKQQMIPVRQGKRSDQIAMCFLKFEISDETRLKTIYMRDSLTGLWTREGFLHHGQKLLESHPQIDWYLIALDIEHFKLFNEWFGQTEGDHLLADIGGLLKDFYEKGTGLAGYFGGDDFFILLPYDNARTLQLAAETSQLVLQYSEVAGFLPLMGVYHIRKDSMLLSGMCDKAQIAITSIKGNYNQRISYYDEGMMERLETRKRLLSDVQKGINNREFTFYAQPKCNLSSGKIVGLEALARWHHPQFGMIPPSEYIPLLEETGLITNLDMYIWEEVCKALSNWLKGGHQALTISMNVSLVDILAVDVPSVFRRLIRKYQIPSTHLGVEITESAYARDIQVVNNTVKELQSMGITILMDDFGSGYSSLNMLKDIKVDVLKMDMKFLEIDDQTYGRGLNIMESIIRLANLMDLRVVAEGVETQEQVDFLKKMGCVYGQGFYFYRPMPIEELDPLLGRNGVIDLRGIRRRQIGHIYAQDLFSAGMINDIMLNNILGAFAFYEEKNGDVKLLRVNDQYCNLMGSNLVDLEDHNQKILEWLHPEDRLRLKEGLKKAYEDPLDEVRLLLRRQHANRAYLWLVVRLFFLWEKAEGQRIYYAAIHDVTDTQKREITLQAFRETLDTMWQITPQTDNLKNLNEENRQLAMTVFAKIAPNGMIGGYCEEGFPLYFANDELVHLLGYDDYESFVEGIHGLVSNTIHPEDLDYVKQVIGSDYYIGLEYSITYRMVRKDGSWFWALDKGRIVEAEDGRLAIISACSDITDIIENQEYLMEKNHTLMQENEELNYYVSRMPGAYHRCVNNEKYDFLYISKRFEEMLGYTREEIREQFDNSFFNMVHPDDRKQLREQTNRLTDQQGHPDMEYRMITPCGYIWVQDQSQYLTYQGIECIQGVVMDITESRRQKENLRLLAETDYLTGLLNRSTAIRKIQNYLKISGTEHAAFVMLDMDNFKRLNDLIGHPGGDRALQRCAKVLQQHFSHNSILCRMGGDEFTIFCRDITVHKLEERLRGLIDELSIPYIDNSQTITLAISAGYVMIPEDGCEFEDLYHKADLALLRVKQLDKGNILRYHSSMNK